MIINRQRFLSEIEKGFKACPIVALLGPRQCGKTTLAHEYIKNTSLSSCFFDMEDIEQLDLLTQTPKYLEKVTEDLIVIDEVQLLDQIFPYLRVFIDNTDKKLLLLGSASRDLITKTSETLAGRIDYTYVTPFNMHEVKNRNSLWIRGGFPRSFLAEDEETSFRWRQSYITTYLERDIPQIAPGMNPALVRQVWMMLTHYHGNIVNYTDIGKSLGISDMSIKRYIQLLEGTFMVRCLQPWFENISKRQVKSQKVYIRDSGILHTLLGVKYEDYHSNPKIGASWEGFAMEQVIAYFNVRPEDCYFWNIQSIGEIDLLIIKDGKKIAFEFKFASVPSVSKRTHQLLDILKPDKFYIVTPGNESYIIDNDIKVRGLCEAGVSF